MTGRRTAGAAMLLLLSATDLCLGATMFPADAQTPVSAVPPNAQVNPGTPGQAGIANTGFGAGPSQQVSQPYAAPVFGAPFSNEHLFGNWGGARTWLQNRGIDVDFDNLTENSGNITGGRRETFAVSGQTALEVDLDLQKLLGLQGGAFHTMTVQRFGRNTSADSIGDDIATTQEIYGGGGNVIAHMVYAYYEQVLLRGRLDLAAGWIPVGTYFAASPLYCDFMNVLFCGNPHPLPNYPGEEDWPQATLGGQGRLFITPSVYLQTGVFATDPNFGTGGGGISGWAWADPDKRGVSIPVEIGWEPSFGRNRLEGHYKVGFDEDTNHYADVYLDMNGQPSVLTGAASAEHDRQDWYVLADQMLLRQGSGDTDGLILFGGWVHASDDVSPLTQHAFAGLVSTGSAWHRPKDVLGVSFNWIEMSGAFTRAEELALEAGEAAPINVDGFGTAYGSQNTEQVVEVAYTASVFRGVSVMPDFQYVIRPGGTTATPDAAVLGFRTNVNF